MAFKFPSIRKRADDPAPFIIKDLPSFNWSDLTDKEEIGRGSFGSVFMARHPAANGDHVVIKKLLGTDEAARRLFVKEAKLLHQLKDKTLSNSKRFAPRRRPSCWNTRVLISRRRLGNSLEDFLHYVDRHDAFDEFPFQ